MRSPRRAVDDVLTRCQIASLCEFNLRLHSAAVFFAPFTSHHIFWRPVMTSSIKATLLLACLAIVAATSLRAADEPKDVALAFAKAMQAGDSKAIHDISVGTPEQLKTIDALAEMMKAIGKFKTACDAKFGADNVLSKSMGQVPDLAAEVTKSEFKVDGDSVTVIDKTNPDDKHPLKLKKADGKWKIDLASD